MHCYYLPVTQCDGLGGITLTIPTLGGQIITSAVGPTREVAETRLRSLISQTLAARVEEGLDPFALLVHGKSRSGNLDFDEVDLFPIVLRLYRRERGITQADMANLMGITQAAYSKLEQFGANPTLRTVVRLQQALGKPMIRFLIGESG